MSANLQSRHIFHPTMFLFLFRCQVLLAFNLLLVIIIY